MKTVKEYRKDMYLIQELIHKVQDKCTHIGHSMEYKSNTGGYDGPAFDRYWVEYKCPTCLKQWSKDQ